jgi:hypothetical protein
MVPLSLQKLTKAFLRTTPTSHYWQAYFGIEDYELKVSITLGVTGSWVIGDPVADC